MVALPIEGSLMKCAKFEVTGDAGETRVIELCDPLKSALRLLIRVGSEGLSPVERPNPRWSERVDDLCARGVSIVSTLNGPLLALRGRPYNYRLKGQATHLGQSEEGDAQKLIEATSAQNFGLHRVYQS